MLGCGGDSPTTQTGGMGGEGGSGLAPGSGGSGGSGATGGTGQACDQRVAASGEVGGACRQNAQCNGDNLCLGEQSFTVGPPIQDHPEGPTYSFDITDFPGDYCTAALPPSFPDTSCSVENQIACQQECGVCVPRFSDADICRRGCRADADTNSACRDGYQCDLLFEVCDTGCSTDDECRVFINEADELVYDTDSTFVCNPQTNRCEHPGAPGAEAGIECTDDQQCEARGICLDEETFGFTGGYCSKIRCDVDPCAGDGICASLGLGVPLCAAECQVGDGADPEDPSTWLNNYQGCRPGQTCFWIGGADDPTGACVEGEYNDVIENNIGDACTESSQCYSPFGQGTCGDADFVCALIGDAPGNCNTGFGCTVLDCAVPGMPDVCGPDAECVVDSATGVSLCAAKCASAEDCSLGGACGDLDGDPTSLDAVCLPFCFEDAECRANEFCNQVGECEADPA